MTSASIALLSRLALPATDRDALPTWLGLVGGFALPMIAAALYATYDISMRSTWLEQTRQLGHVWLLGELALIVHAMRNGFTVRAAWTALLVGRAPRWLCSCPPSGSARRSCRGTPTSRWV